MRGGDLTTVTLATVQGFLREFGDILKTYSEERKRDRRGGGVLCGGFGCLLEAKFAQDTGSSAASARKLQEKQQLDWEKPQLISIHPPHTAVLATLSPLTRPWVMTVWKTRIWEGEKLVRGPASASPRLAVREIFGGLLGGSCLRADLIMLILRFWRYGTCLICVRCR